MKLPVKDLLPILNLVKSFTADRDIVPALKSIYFGQDTVRAYSGDAGAVWYCPWTWPGEFAVSGAQLVRIIGSLNDQGIEEVDFDLKPATLQLKAAGFKGALPILKPEAMEMGAFVMRDPPGEAARLPVEPLFWSTLSRATFGVSKDQTKPMLCGVYWSGAGIFVTSDGARITLVMPKAQQRVPAPKKDGVLIPEHLLQRLTGRLSEANAIALEENLMWIYLSSGAVYGNLIEGAFPASAVAGILKRIREASKAGQGTWAMLPTGVPLDMVLNRLMFFTEPPIHRTAVRVLSGDCVFRVGAQVDPAAEEIVPAKVDGPPEQGFSLNIKFLRDALQVCNRLWYCPDFPLYLTSEDGQVEHILLLLKE